MPHSCYGIVADENKVRKHPLHISCEQVAGTILRKIQASTLSLHKMSGPHFLEGTSKHQSVHNVTLTMFNNDRHIAKVNIKREAFNPLTFY
jgi:hypothetical protein